MKAIAASFALFGAALLGGCLSHPPPPPAPYHAVGQDARWHLIIDDQNVTFIPAGGQPLVQPKPQPIIGVAGEIYRTRRIEVNIVHGRCVIGDRVYPDNVQVYVDGTLHSGCGGDPALAGDTGDAIELADTQWRVALVNGRPTPLVGDYSMSFEENRISARLGCNHIGGDYDLDGRTLTVTGLISTLMGCPEPAATFERQAKLILERPMEVEVAADGRLVLSNEAGTIGLTPVL